MIIENKVHITLTIKDVNEILIEHFKKQGIDVKEFYFNIESVHDNEDRYNTTFEINKITGEGKRI